MSQANSAQTDPPYCSVVVPVYNSEATLRALVERLGRVFAELGRSYEIVLVDDGSRDGSWQVLQELHTRGEQPILAIRFMRNQGQHRALKCGLDHCSGQYAVTMDDDLQHPPEEIPKLLAAIEADPETDVIMSKFELRRHARWRNLGSWLHRRLLCAVFGQSRDLWFNSFLLINRPVIEEIRQTRHARPRLGPLILSITSRVKNVTVRHEPRATGRSGYTLGRLIGDALDAILSYSALPLRLVSWLGLGSAVVSLLLGVFYLVAYLLGITRVSGFTTTILAILFTGGVMLFSVGLVGEYLERIIAQQMMSVQYHVRTVLPRREVE